MQLNCFCNIDSETGYSLHARWLTKALSEAGVDVALEGSGSSEEPWASMCKKNYKKETTLVIATPNIWQIKFADKCKKLIGYGVFEGDKIPEHWEKLSNSGKVDEIWVPSRHVKDAFQNSGVSIPIKIVPHGVDEKVFNLDAKLEANVDKETFNFVFCGGWADGVKDRKGLDILCQAFTEEFGPEDKVHLYAKINMVYQPAQVVQANFEKLNLKPKEQRRPITLLLQQFSKESLASLYRSCDVVVAPSKAEGFNMPVLEAMSCGCAPIVTNYGGQLDFVSDAPGYKGLIDFTMAPATGGVWYDQAQWAMPDKEHLKKLLREAFEKRVEIRAGKEEVSKYVLENWKWSDAAKKAKELLENASI